MFVLANIRKVNRLLVCIFILNLQMDRQLVVAPKLAMWKCKQTIISS